MQPALFSYLAYFPFKINTTLHAVLCFRYSLAYILNKQFN